MIKIYRRELGIGPFALLVSLVAFLAFGLVGCDDPLDVENPNSLVEEDLDDPIAANALANGSLNNVAIGVASVLTPTLTATDEIVWIGSRDAWRELDFGNVAFAGNEFSDQAMKNMHRGRWMADKAVATLEKFDSDIVNWGERIELARGYLYAGMVRIYIADWFDDWVFSHKTEAATNVGASNMNSVYADAISYLDKALSIAQSESDTDLQTRILALRARAKHASAIWTLLSGGTTPASPWVNAGTADAEAALALMADDNYKWQFLYAPGTETNDLSENVNGRKELQITGDPNGNLPVNYIGLNDPITGTADPRVLAIIADFRDTDTYNGTAFAPIAIASAREMNLIIAEGLLASGNSAGAIEKMNAIRALDALTPITVESADEMLKHERRANLHLTGRRLNDLYRYGERDPMWQSTSDAFNNVGTLLPITDAELQTNPTIND